MNNTAFLTGLNDLLQTPPIGLNRELSGLIHNAQELLKPIKEQAEKLIEKGKEILQTGSSSLQNKTNHITTLEVEQLKGDVTDLGAKLTRISGQVRKEVQKRTFVAIKNQQMAKRVGGHSEFDDKNISLYKMFEKCLQRLAEIPQHLYCEILGCESGEEGAIATTPSETGSPPHITLSPNESSGE